MQRAYFCAKIAPSRSATTDGSTRVSTLVRILITIAEVGSGIGIEVLQELGNVEEIVL